MLSNISHVKNRSVLAWTAKERDSRGLNVLSFKINGLRKAKTFQTQFKNLCPMIETGVWGSAAAAVKRYDSSSV
jgi:hypothetical protein